MERLKILVVDDESRMRKLVRDFLVREDYEVLEAGDGEEALDIFYKEKNIALIILDVMMPKINGWDVCREVRETSKVPIIMLTAKSDESDELTGFELGVDEYISKPFSKAYCFTGDATIFIPLPFGLSTFVTTAKMSCPALYIASNESLAKSGVPIKTIFIFITFLPIILIFLLLNQHNFQLLNFQP